MIAKHAIDMVVQESKPLVANLVPVDQILAIIRIEDPFDEKPEDTYKLIEDWVIDHLPTVYQRIDQLVDAVTNNLRIQKVGEDTFTKMVLITAAHVLVDYIIQTSNRTDIYDRYSDNAIMHHVFDRAKSKMSTMGLTPK
jgi:hypothetical protein